MVPELQARFKVGEQMGPYVVESVEWVPMGDGSYLEKVINSGRSVMQILHRPIQPPLQYLLPIQTDQIRYVIPYVPNYKNEHIRHPLTVAGAPLEAHWVSVYGSPWNYWSLLTAAWDVKHDLFLIEHDVESTPEQRADINACPEPWCLNQYHHFSEEDREAWKWGVLGHTRFRQELISAHPRLMADLEPRWRDWHETSTGVGMALRELGYEPHEHGRVKHHRMDETRCGDCGCAL